MKPPHEFNPDYSEVGLSNSVIYPGDGENSLDFDGKIVTEPLNVILKLRTMPSQPEVEVDPTDYWWIDDQHLLQALKFWKKRNLLCLRGVRIAGIQDMESKCCLSWWWRQKNEQKVANSWKHLMTKSYNILAKYHKELLEEFGITGGDENGHMVFESEIYQNPNSKHYSGVPLT